jgi:hypothetical protein
VAEIEKFFDKQHLFLSENVSEVTFNAPDKRLEKVIASRISGLKNPLFVMMLSSLQSETFYDSRISIGDKNYMNPFQKNALPKYWFHLEDTLLSPNTTDTSFVVSFRPRAGKNFDGLAGQVTISTSGWAFQNVIARPQTTDKGLNIHIEQKYKQIGDSIWFPHQLSTEIFMENIQAENIPIVGRGKRYIDQIRLSADSVADIKSGIEIEIPDDLRKKTQTSLPAFRRIPATAKDSATYHVIDSISKVHHLEKKINGFMALMKGQFRMGKFDIPLGRLLDYNLYEKWRVGLGIKTNDRIHFPISLGGYVAYSSGDHKWKSGVASTFYPDRLKRHSLTYSYINDIESPAQTVFDKPMMEGKLSESSYRNFFFEDFFSVHQHEVMLQNQISTFLNIKTGIRKTSSRALFNYRFDGTSKFLSTVLWTEWRLAPGEKFIKTANKLITKGSRFPVLKLRYDKGIEQWDGAISYHSVAAVLSDDFYTNFIGKTSYQLHAGWVSKTVPLPFLFSAKGSHGNSLNLNCPWSFATMNIHEFMNDQYVALFLRHNFGQLLFSSKWLSPDIVLRHSMMAGKLSHPEEHELLYLGDTHKGYFESGVVFENILKGPFSGIGMGLFYRYGPYRLKKTSENLFINLSIKFLQAD